MRCGNLFFFKVASAACLETFLEVNAVGKDIEVWMDGGIRSRTRGMLCYLPARTHARMALVVEAIRVVVKPSCFAQTRCQREQRQTTTDDKQEFS